MRRSPEAPLQKKVWFVLVLSGQGEYWVLVPRTFGVMRQIRPAIDSPRSSAENGPTHEIPGLFSRRRRASFG